MSFREYTDVPPGDVGNIIRVLVNDGALKITAEKQSDGN